MSRTRSFALLVLVILVAYVGLRLSSSGGNNPVGCEGVRRVYERVSFIEESGDIPTSGVYRTAARALRDEAALAPSAVAMELTRLADAYGRLSAIYRGFDPQDESTYARMEERTVEREAEEAVVAQTIPAVGGWLDSRCS